MCCSRVSSDHQSMPLSPDEKRAECVLLSLRVGLYITGILCILGGIASHFLIEDGGYGGIILFGAVGLAIIFAALACCQNTRNRLHRIPVELPRERPVLTEDLNLADTVYQLKKFSEGKMSELDHDALLFLTAEGKRDIYEKALRKRLVEAVREELRTFFEDDSAQRILSLCDGLKINLEGLLLFALKNGLKNSEKLLRESGAKTGIQEELAAALAKKPSSKPFVDLINEGVKQAVVTVPGIAPGILHRAFSSGIESLNAAELATIDASSFGILTWALTLGKEEEIRRKIQLVLSQPHEMTLLQWAIANNCVLTAEELQKGPDAAKLGPKEEMELIAKSFMDNPKNEVFVRCIQLVASDRFNFVDASYYHTRDEVREELTLLQWSVAYSKNQSALMLIGKGAKLEVRDINGNTPLIQSARNQSWELMRALAQRGAVTDAYNEAGETALHWCAAFGTNSDLELLLSNAENLELGEINKLKAGTLESWARVKNNRATLTYLTDSLD